MGDQIHHERSLGELLREFRQRRGWTQEDLAEHAAVSLRTIRNAEVGDHKPQVSTLNLLADALALPQADRDALAATRRRRGGASAPLSVDRSMPAMPAETTDWGRNLRPTVRASAAWRRSPRIVAAVLVASVVVFGLVAWRLDDRLFASVTPVTPVTSPPRTGLSGLWVGPRAGFEINEDTLLLSSRALPTNPLDPPVTFVNFTVRWDGPGGGWHPACASFQIKAGTADTYECVWHLTPEVPDGPIMISFDVYNEHTNHNAPHGMRNGTVRRRP